VAYLALRHLCTTPDGKLNQGIRQSTFKTEGSLQLVDSRPAQSAGRKKKLSSKPLKMFVFVTKGLCYPLMS